MAIDKVILVGAGPSGLLLALLLSKHHPDLHVDLLEKASSLDTNPRASHYTPEANMEFERAGILSQVREAGMDANGVSWRKMDENKTRLCRLRNPVPKTKEEAESDEFRYRMTCLPLHKLGRILEAELLKLNNVNLLYGHEVVDISQAPEKAAVEVKVAAPEDGPSAASTTITMIADYVVGSDGANSTIRRKLFGDWNWPGFTWDRQIVATNMYYDFSPYDYDDSQFFIDPEHWHMVARIQPDGLYRVTYGEADGKLGYDELKKRQPAKFETILPGNPKPDQYKLVGFSPYKVHQRCVDKMRLGRFLLVADAAHLCNPL